MCTCGRAPAACRASPPCTACTHLQRACVTHVRHAAHAQTPTRVCAHARWQAHFLERIWGVPGREDLQPSLLPGRGAGQSGKGRQGCTCFRAHRSPPGDCARAARGLTLSSAVWCCRTLLAGTCLRQRDTTCGRFRHPCSLSSPAAAPAWPMATPRARVPCSSHLGRVRSS